jgi:carbon monoxide dehydrogenase subunit G
MTHSGSFAVRRTADDVYALLADPRQFAPLLPDYESMELQDATHFRLRTVIAAGKISGHANLEMTLYDCVPAEHVKYRGEGVIAGSTITFGVEFVLTPAAGLTEVRWAGEVSVEGMLALMARDIIESKGRADFERMAERLQQRLSREPDTVPETAGAPEPPTDPGANQ